MVKAQREMCISQTGKGKGKILVTNPVNLGVKNAEKLTIQKYPLFTSCMMLSFRHLCPRKERGCN